MRTVFVITLLFFFLSSDGQLNTGVKGGISIPNLKGNTGQSKGYVSRQDIYGGLFANFKITHSLYLQPEINFSPQGGQRKGLQQIPSDAISGISLPPGTDLYANFKSITVLNYLEIPILAKLLLGNKLKYYLCFGPHIAFLLNAKTKTSGSSLLYLDEAGTTPLTESGNALPPISFNNTTNIQESIKKINAGVQGGIGIEYPFGPGNIVIDGRAIIGMVNIQAHPETDGKNKTGSLALSIGYLIRIE
jgi:hypothetical protein